MEMGDGGEGGVSIRLQMHEKDYEGGGGVVRRGECWVGGGMVCLGLVGARTLKRGGGWGGPKQRDPRKGGRD